MDNNKNNINKVTNPNTSNSNRLEPNNIKRVYIKSKRPDDMNQEMVDASYSIPANTLNNGNELDNKHDRSKREAFADNDKRLTKEGNENTPVSTSKNTDAKNAASFAGNPTDIEAGYQSGINGINGNNQVNKSRVNKQASNNGVNPYNKLNRAFDLNNRQNNNESNNQNNNEGGGRGSSSNKGSSNGTTPGATPSNANQSNQAPLNTPKNKKSPSSTNNANNNNGTNKASALGNAAKIGSNLAKVGALKNQLESAQEQGEEAKEVAKKVAKEKAKQVVKRKIVSAVASVILPILPYILVGLLVIGAILAIVIFVTSIFNILTDEDNIYGEMQINYCGKVNLSWEETKDWEAGEVEISSDEYLAYLIEHSPYTAVENAEAMKAIAMIYRTNFYANADNLDSDICYYDIDSPYGGVSNDLVISSISATDNRVFALQKDTLSELTLDDKFSYTSTEELAGYQVYRLYQDNLAYKTEWIDSHIEEENRENRNYSYLFSFSPFAAYYLAEEHHYNYEALLYHFYSPGNSYTQIYRVQKKSGGGFGGSGGYGGCSDISLSSTTLSREEFIQAVETHVSNSDFRNNAGKIYDMSIANNFNPEMVIIRAYLEGNFTPQGGAYNYWGLACFNGNSTCQSFNSFDEGVMAYINNIKSHNYSTLYEMMSKYAYLGDYWFNPGGSGLGGCYYFPYISKYMSEGRISEVNNACASGKSCSKGGVGDCTATTDEDKMAYTKYQSEKMVNARATIFGLGAEDCDDDFEEYTGDPSEIGYKVVEYAKSHFTGCTYTQVPNLRNQPGYCDCSSLVSRSYAHFGINLGGNTEGIYNWCKNNNRFVNASNVQVGDIILYNHGSYANSAHVNNIGHVALYSGPGRIFAAHGVGKPTGESSYANNGDYFCRPS